VFNIIVFVPIDTADAVMFWIEEEPCTTKFCDINNEPVIVCVPKNVFEPVVAKAPFNDACDAVKLNKEAVVAFNAVIELFKLDVVVFKEAVAAFNDPIEDINDAVAVFKEAVAAFNDPIDELIDEVAVFRDAVVAFNAVIELLIDDVAVYRDDVAAFNDKIDELMEDVAVFKAVILDATDPDHMLDYCSVVVTS
jgi:hypothetical protein